MSIKTINADGIVSSDVQTGKLVWVDAVNGVDALAKRGRMTIPFKTLSAAADSASSGDTIMVLPGTYNDQDLFRDGVNWHFLNGAKVVGIVSGTDNALFNVGSAGTTRITGEGDFDSGAADYVLLVDDPDAEVTFKAYKLKGSGAALRVNDSKMVSVEADTLIGEGGAGPPVYIVDGSLHVHARLISCASNHAIYVVAGKANITADTVVSLAAYGVHVEGGELVANLTEIFAEALYDGAGIVVGPGSAIVKGCRITGSYGIKVNSGSLIADFEEILADAGSAANINGGTMLLKCISLRSENASAIEHGYGNLHVEGAKIYSGVMGFPAVLLYGDGLTLRNCWIYTTSDACIDTISSDPFNCNLIDTAANVDPGLYPTFGLQTPIVNATCVTD